MKFKPVIAFTFAFTFSLVIKAQPPTGYYDNAAGKSCADLKTTLKTIISTGSTRSYSALWTQYELTDIKPREIGPGTSANVIWDIYSEKPTTTDPYNFTPSNDQCGNYNGEGDCYNREHTVPQSWFNSSTTPSSDYLHIFPTDGYVNGKRSNFPYGEVATASWTSMNGSKLGTSAIAGITSTVFEPLDSFKGDVARAFLYFVTKYENSMATWAGNTEAAEAFEPNTYPSVDIPFLETMIRWHYLDPVSNKELTRNNGAYSFQQNRNPYIDHPEYVGQVWNNTCPGLSALPVSIVLFKGVLNENKVNLSWIVENETSLDRYEVEQSLNDAAFQRIGSVKAANAHNYSFTDNAERNAGRQLYYRLKKIDKNGSFSYSKTLFLNIPLNTKFKVYPNPSIAGIQLHISSGVKGSINLELSDIAGRVVLKQSLMSNSNLLQFPTNNLHAGTYFLKIVHDGGQNIQKVIVTK